MLSAAPQRVLTHRIAAWLVLRRTEECSEKDHALLADLRIRAPELDEAVALAEALTGLICDHAPAGQGGILAVHQATGITRSTIGRGLRELRRGCRQLEGRVRRHGAGRRAATESAWASAFRPIARPARTAAHPDRNAQFEHINAEVKAFQAAGQPVISLDTKKKELVGDPRDKSEGMLQERRTQVAPEVLSRAGSGA